MGAEESVAPLHSSAAATGVDPKRSVAVAVGIARMFAAAALDIE